MSIGRSSAIQLPTECNFELCNDMIRVIHREQKRARRETYIAAVASCAYTQLH